MTSDLMLPTQGALGMSGGQWAADWQTTKSSKCLHLHRRLAQIGAAPSMRANPDSSEVHSSPLSAASPLHSPASPVSLRGAVIRR